MGAEEALRKLQRESWLFGAIAAPPPMQKFHLSPAREAPCILSGAHSRLSHRMLRALGSAA